MQDAEWKMYEKTGGHVRVCVVCIAGAQVSCVAKGNAPRQDRTTDLPLTKRVLYH